MVNAPHPLMTTSEVAEAFAVNERTIKRWRNAGKVASVRTPGGFMRFFRAEVEAILAGQPLTPAQIAALREQVLDGAP